MSTPTAELPAWDDTRIHLLDDTWFLTIFAVLLATALPWFLGAFAIDFAHASLGVFALGVIQVVLSTGALPKHISPRLRNSMHVALHAVGVVALGFIWLHAGGTANPSFLLAFALPVIGASFISRWQPYFTAMLAAAVVFAVAATQEPEFRWYVSGFGRAGGWFAAALGGEDTSVGAKAVPGFYAPLGYYSVLLQVFAVLLSGCAVAADYLGTLFERLRTQLVAARAQAQRGQELWTSLTEHLPVPALLVDAGTLRVICASQPAASDFLSAGETFVGRLFREAIRFSYPDEVQSLIEGEGGTIPGVMVRVADELRAMDVSVQHVPYAGQRFALVILLDMTDTLCMKLALDVADQAVLVIDPHGRIKAFNKPARVLFADTRVGASVSGLLLPIGWGTDWWRSGLSGRRKAHVEIRKRTYEITISSVALPGEEESLHVITLRPAARVLADNPRASAPAPTIEVESR